MWSLPTALRSGLDVQHARPGCPCTCSSSTAPVHPYRPRDPCQLGRVVSRTVTSRGTSLVVGLARRQASAVSSSLISVLKDEVKYEQESYRKPDVLRDDPPGDFEKDEDVPGTNVFTFSKQYNNETIRVVATLDTTREMDLDDLDDEDEGYVEDEDEEDGPVTFQVVVTKEWAGQELVFTCETDGEYLTVSNVALQHEAGPQLAYTGPPFDELDDTLQQAFIDYLEERGVNADLGEYVRLYLADKAKLEYQQWLNDVKDFINL